MANLFVGSNYYISDVYVDSGAYYVNTHMIDSEGEYTETKNYAFGVDQPIDNLSSVGAVTEFKIFSNSSVVWANTSQDVKSVFTGVTPESTTGSGNGLIVDINTDRLWTRPSDDPIFTFTITNPGSGYSIGDGITYDYASANLDTDYEKLTVTVSNTDIYGVNYFPDGLDEDSLVANALPLINVILSTGSE